MQLSKQELENLNIELREIQKEKQDMIETLESRHQELKDA